MFTFGNQPKDETEETEIHAPRASIAPDTIESKPKRKLNYPARGTMTVTVSPVFQSFLGSYRFVTQPELITGFSSCSEGLPRWRAVCGKSARTVREGRGLGDRPLTFMRNRQGIYAMVQISGWLFTLTLDTPDCGYNTAYRHADGTRVTLCPTLLGWSAGISQGGATLFGIWFNVRDHIKLPTPATMNGRKVTRIESDPRGSCGMRTKVKPIIPTPMIANNHSNFFL